MCNHSFRSGVKFYICNQSDRSEHLLLEKLVPKLEISLMQAMQKVIMNDLDNETKRTQAYRTLFAKLSYMPFLQN